MLKLTVAQVEAYDEDKEEFVLTGGIDIELEHSLATLSKWESIYEKPFLTVEEKTAEDALSYIRVMIQTPDLPDDILERFTERDFQAINRFIDAKMTATWFRELPGQGSASNREAVTAELVYFWMISYQIPFECQYWHLNKLFTLIKVCNAKNAKPQKQNPSDAAAERARLNAMRKAQEGHNG